jgi:2-methylcitrate dehydratase PrpD
MNPAHLERGFHTTATVGPFAAATAAALLLGLDRDGFARALGLAGLQGAGLMEVFHDGAMAKPFQAARASAAGLLAAQLAAEGAVGPRGILEGEQGFLAAMCGRRETGGLAEGLGQDWAIRGIYFKEHAACRHTHAAVDAAAALREQHALRPEQVERVLVQTYRVADRLCGDPRLPSGPSEAKFSLPFTVALGLTFGHARQSCFSVELIADGGLRALASRVRIEVDPSLDRLYPRQRPTRLEVLTADGRRLRAEVMMARGEPELPLSQAELEAKFLDNARGRLSPEQARAVVDRIASLESLPDCSPLLDLLATRPVHDPLPA